VGGHRVRTLPRRFAQCQGICQVCVSTRQLPRDLGLAHFPHGSEEMSSLANHCVQSIVWIDDQRASILRMEEGLQLVSTILADGAGERPNVLPSVEGEATKPGTYFHRVARAIDVADEILIVGPSDTKVDFAKYMHKDDHAIDPRILGVETIAHPTDAQLIAFANLYFTVGGPRRSGNGSGHPEAE
jgi:hypothetical protein